MGKELLPDELARHVAAALLKGQRQHWEVSAVPGAGKTTFLVHLLTVLLERRVRPEAIMVLSFANSTVNELNRRMIKACADAHLDRKVAMRLKTISGRTFHSFAQTVLSEKNAKLLLGRDVQNQVIAAATQVLRKYKKASATDANTSLVSHLRALLEDADCQQSLRKVFDLARSSGRSPDALADEVGDGELDELIPVIPELLRAYPEHGPAMLSEDQIAMLCMKLGDLVATKWKEWKGWAYMPDVAIAYVDVSETMELGRHVVCHSVHATPQRKGFRYLIDPAPWLPAERHMTTSIDLVVPEYYIGISRASGGTVKPTAAKKA